MIPFRFKNVFLESFALNLPTQELSSAEIEDRIAPLYERLQIPFGTLERLSGIKSRHMWTPDVRPSAVSTVAAAEALELSGFKPEQIGALFNCSVSRDFFEPATACIIHNNLKLGEECYAMDITNACLGFSNGMLSMAQLIESGAVQVGIITAGENVSRIMQSSWEQLARHQTLTRDELLKMLPTFTLGCGAVAMVMCHRSVARSTHRLLGAVARSATQFSSLCEGNGDFNFSQEGITPLMSTESALLMASAAKLGGRMWKDASEVLGWSREEIDHVYCHQVGRQVNEGFYREMALDMEKEFTVYKTLGNLVSAALPAALITGAKEKGMKPGDKVLLTGFGSGLNSIFSGIEW